MPTPIRVDDAGVLLVTFHRSFPVDRSKHATAGDQDGDGLVDLAVGCDDDAPTLSIVSGASIRLGTPAVLATVTDSYEGTFVADHDGDGAPELVLAAPSGTGWWLRRSETLSGTTAPADGAVTIEGATGSVGGVDADGDGRAELVFATGLFGQGSGPGTLTTSPWCPTGTRSRSIPGWGMWAGPPRRWCWCARRTCRARSPSRLQRAPWCPWGRGRWAWGAPRRAPSWSVTSTPTAAPEVLTDSELWSGASLAPGTLPQPSPERASQLTCLGDVLVRLVDVY